MEIWKDIKGYEGHYQISNLGRVESIKFKKEIIMKIGLSSSGYSCIRLRIDKKYMVECVVKIL